MLLEEQESDEDSDELNVFSESDEGTPLAATSAAQLAFKDR